MKRFSAGLNKRWDITDSADWKGSLLEDKGHLTTKDTKTHEGLWGLIRRSSVFRQHRGDVSWSLSKSGSDSWPVSINLTEYCRI